MGDSTGNWTEFTLSGHRCERFEPQYPNPHGYVLIYLHGVHLGRLREQPRFVEALQRHGLPVIAPITERSWWTDRICPEFDPQISAESYVMEHLVPHLAEAFDARPPRIGLFGTSMGGQGALRLAYKHPSQFPVVAAISPAIDYQIRMRDDPDDPLWQMYDSAEQARQDTATLHIHPLNWPRKQFFCCCPEDRTWWDSCDRLRMKLYSLGVPFECDLDTRGGGHGFDYYNLMAETVVQFLWDGLESERRRVA